MEWSIVSVVWFLGHSPLAGALVIGMFWAAMGSPERIRNRSEFRLAALCLGASVLASVTVPLAILAFALPKGDRVSRSGEIIWMLSLVPIPSILMTLAILLGIDSVMPGRSTLTPPKPTAEAPRESS